MARGKPQGAVITTIGVAEAKHYLITRPNKDDFTGKDKYVQFYLGVGVLDLDALVLERPDWVKNVGGTLVQETGVTIGEYVDYWERRLCRVDEITAEKAEEFRAYATSEKRRLETLEIMRARARQKAKTMNKEEQSRDFEQAVLEAPEAPAPIAPEPETPASTEPMPHELPADPVPAIPEAPGPDEAPEAPAPE
jgi:hypothetical protein